MNVLMKIGPEPVALARGSGAESSPRILPAADRLAGAQRRYLSIDVLRALAILLMIQVHFVENLSAESHAPQLLY
ncbi:MAG TPA: heparan-alpha-glucosaminide N-acetyltransferase domain-containing protein, partial [Casimicrobiaceae bacterium]|nr:heparan-alpha-glucosaminide N-acetyltransferase domain-containing protein [Casimicrobiaceae bacterium]